MAEAGVYRFGIADAAPVDEYYRHAYSRWIEQGMHGTMTYLGRYHDVRSDPRLLLPGARSVISCAIPYYYPLHPGENRAGFASYALGSDYHDVVRQHLETVARFIRDNFGGETRVCVDTAPIRERYWAMRSGVGFIGRNNQLIVPGAGSYFFLGEILTTQPFQADKPCTLTCGDCGRCTRLCPSGALSGCGAADASRCLSYLTIEHRGPFEPLTDLHGHIYGCDVCLQVCPHNANPPVATIDELRPRKAVLELTRAAIVTMTQEEFSVIFRRSAVKRAKLEGLRRNACHPLTHSKGLPS